MPLSGALRLPKNRSHDRRSTAPGAAVPAVPGVPPPRRPGWRDPHLRRRLREPSRFGVRSYLAAPRPAQRARAAAARVRGELLRGADHLERRALCPRRPHRALPRLLLAAAVLPQGEGVRGSRVPRPLGVPAQPHPGAGRPDAPAHLGARVDVVRLLVPGRELLLPPALADRGRGPRNTSAGDVSPLDASRRYTESAPHTPA